jgi:hypothetical protein
MTTKIEEAIILFDGKIPQDILSLSNQIKKCAPATYQIDDIVIVPPGRCAVVMFTTQDISAEYFPRDTWIYAVTKEDQRHIEYFKEELLVSIS